jgi:hypothetical protein
MMSRSGSDSAKARDREVKRMVLTEIVSLLPERLTVPELAVCLEDGPKDTDRLTTVDAVGALKRDGLVRLTGEIVEPTHAALSAAEIFQAF